MEQKRELVVCGNRKKKHEWGEKMWRTIFVAQSVGSDLLREKANLNRPRKDHFSGGFRGLRSIYYKQPPFGCLRNTRVGGGVSSLNPFWEKSDYNWWICSLWWWLQSSWVYYFPTLSHSSHSISSFRRRLCWAVSVVL